MTRVEVWPRNCEIFCIGTSAWANACRVAEDMRRAGDARTLRGHSDRLLDALHRVAVPFDHMVRACAARGFVQGTGRALVNRDLRSPLVRLFATGLVEVARNRATQTLSKSALFLAGEGIQIPKRLQR